VRIRDAADKLGHDLPTITITESSGIDYLHEQMQSLMREIEHMVERLHQREREVLRAEQMAAVGNSPPASPMSCAIRLTAVKMLVATSREDFESRGLPAEDLQIIETEIQRLERSLQAFLDFARPPKMERRQLDLSSVIEQALTLLSGRAKKQGVRIIYAPPEPAVWLEADGEQVRQLLVNLAMNAFDAMPHGGMLTFDVLPMRLERLYVEVHVSDTGAGISNELLPRLFQPFVSGKETGLGLGPRRVAAHRGGARRPALGDERADRRRGAGAALAGPAVGARGRAGATEIGGAAHRRLSLRERAPFLGAKGDDVPLAWSEAWRRRHF